MKTVPGQLRGNAVKCAPCLAMTATGINEEIDEIKVDLGLRQHNTVVIKCNPVQNQFKFVRVQRPPNIYGSFGCETSAGGFQPGLVDLLNKLHLDNYVKKVTSGEPVKKSIWFFRNEDDIADVYDALCKRLPEQSNDPLTCPFVMNHSNIGPVTAESYRRRKDQINLYLSTSVMLLGLDLSNIDIIGIVRPLNMLHYLIQAAGRGGRNTGTGQRRRVVCYLLWNKSDIGSNVPGISDEVREFCETKSCLKEYLMNYFDSNNTVASSADPDWCCSNCD